MISTTITSQLSPTVTSDITISFLILSSAPTVHSTKKNLATKIKDDAQSVTPTIVPIQADTISESKVRHSVSITITVTVAALAGVIGLLIVLLMGVCGFFLCIFFHTRKRKQSLLEAPQNQDINNLATEITLHDKWSSIPVFTNTCYQKRSSLLVHELSDPPTVYCYPEIYSEIEKDRGSGQYDDIIVNHYDVIPEDVKPSCEKESISDND